MNRLTIKSRLLLSFGLLAAVMLLIAVMALQSLDDAQAELRLYVSGIAARSAKADEYSAAVANRAIAVRNMLLTPQDSEGWSAFARQAESAHAQAQSLVADLLALAAPEKDAPLQARDYIERLADVERRYGPVAVAIVGQLKAGHREQAMRSLVEECQPLLAQLESLIADYHAYTRKRSDELLEQAQTHAESHRRLLAAVCALALCVAMGAAYLVSRSIVSPINDAVKLAESVADGDLTLHLPVDGPDEIAHLLGALSRMNGSLGEIVRTVRGSSDSIATGSGQIAVGNADLSSRTERQAGALQETAATMRELGDMVSRNAGNAESAKTLAAHATLAANKSDTAVGKVSATMDAIRGSSERVMTIISLIDGLAFRTNLLALNAAVEAARAGEQGRGFAIVAAEVRALAQRSAEAAKEIASLIAESTGHVREGVSRVNEAGETMRDALQSIVRVQSLVSDIADESQRQSMGVSEVGVAVGRIDDATQQNAALVEQSAAASVSLNTQARLLAQTVARFRLPARPAN